MNSIPCELHENWETPVNDTFEKKLVGRGCATSSTGKLKKLLPRFLSLIPWRNIKDGITDSNNAILQYYGAILFYLIVNS